jgi:hypothetical protein
MNDNSVSSFYVFKSKNQLLSLYINHIHAKKIPTKPKTKYNMSYKLQKIDYIFQLEKQPTHNSIVLIIYSTQYYSAHLDAQKCFSHAIKSAATEAS